MKEFHGRFHIEHRTKVLDEYVLYVEDLHVSFKDNSLKKELRKKIKDLKEEIKKLQEKGDEKSILESNKKIDFIIEQIKNTKDKNNLKELKKKFKLIENKESDEAKNILLEIKETKKQIRLKDPTRKHVLQGVTFGLRKGETLSIVGENGAGKTVMLETILGLKTPDYFNKIILNLGRRHYANNLKQVGIQYQQSKISSSITVRKLIGQYKKLYSERIDDTLIDEMLVVFQIKSFLNSKVNELSGGQKQRLNLLLSVIHQPKIMILDEFITGLDVKSVSQIINFINELKIKLGASIILISHQPEEIEELSDRVLVMKKGKIVEETYVEDIIHDYGDVTQFVKEVI